MALARRGLRERPWAVEVDESAYAFLIEKGFSAELGARPLRRAIQRYVEDPLSEELIRGNLGDGEVEVYMDAGQISYRPAGAGELVADRLRGQGLP